MSHFYGTVKGQAETTVTRRGSKNSGITTHTASWSGAISCSMSIVDGEDLVEVWMVPWQARGSRHLIYHGPVVEFKPSNEKPDLIEAVKAIKECLSDLEHYVSSHGPGPDKRLTTLKRALGAL